MSHQSTSLVHRAALVAVLCGVVACSSTNTDATPQAGGTITAGSGEPAKAVTIKLVAPGGWVRPASLDVFTATTGIAVEVLDGGEAGTMITKATLAAGNPEADVLWGIDNALLSRLDDEDGAKVFAPYTPRERSLLDPSAVELVTNDFVVPVDTGDICVNVDTAWFSARGLAPPASLDDLLAREYKDLLVVQDPRTSSPGLGFLLTTVADRSADGFARYWRALADNGVKVVDSWTTAYFTEFTAGGGDGTRPLVVSYASSPPAGITADRPVPTTTALLNTCFRQVEFAGVLAGTTHEAAARALIDFFLTEQFQAELPESNFVYPVRTGVALPNAFAEFGRPSPDPFRIAPEVIAANRQMWIETWTQAIAP